MRECLLDGVMRTVIDTPVPLTDWQRLKVRDYAMRYYRKRMAELRGWKREGAERILSELDQNTFLERPVPKSDSEQECLIFGS
jgi:hypothetical protein